jgi:hypothetical protein
MFTVVIGQTVVFYTVQVFAFPMGLSDHLLTYTQFNAEDGGSMFLLTIGSCIENTTPDHNHMSICCSDNRTFNMNILIQYDVVRHKHVVIQNSRPQVLNGFLSLTHAIHFFGMMGEIY